MTVLANYNIIKEGNLHNVESYTSTLSVEKLTENHINGLYDGDLSSSVTTITGSTVSGSVYSVQNTFGEAYKINTVIYYQNSTTLSGIEITYGSDTAEDFTASLTLSGTTVHTNILGDARFIKLTHSCSPGVEISPKQLVVEGVENEFIGFGTSSSDETTTLFVKSSPIGYKSSVPVEIPVFNEYTQPVSIKVAPTPTGSPYDDYVFLSTSQDGEYYGINDFGFSVPASELLVLENDTLVDKSFTELKESWDIFEGSIQSRIYSDSDGTHVAISNSYGNAPDRNGNTFWGLMSKGTFTGNQSFTIKVQVKLTKLVDSFHNEAAIVLGFSCGMPQPSTSFNRSWPTNDENSIGRPVASATAVGFATFDGDWDADKNSNGYYMFHADGTLAEYGRIPRSWTTTDGFTINEFGAIVDGGSSNNKDATTSAGFREIILTWDHVERTAVSYMDRLEIGRHTFNEPPTDGARIFFGYITSGGNSADCIFKNFEIDTQNLYKQRPITDKSGASASAQYTLDTISLGPEHLIDGVYSGYDSVLQKDLSYLANQSWWGRDPTQLNDWIKVDFSEPKDIVSVGFVNPSSNRTTTLSGISGPSTYGSKLIKSVSLTVDSHAPVFYSLSDGYSKMSTRILLDSFGNRTVFSGTSSVNVSLLDFYEKSGATKDSVMLEELIFTEAYLEPVRIFPSVTSSGSVPWSRGIFNNMKPSGGSGLWKINRHDVADVAKAYDSEVLVEGVDFGYSSSFYPLINEPGLVSPPMAQTIFRTRSDANTTSNSIGRWAWTGHPAYIWRVFKEKHPIKGICWGFSFNHGSINKFKVQYLKDGENPNEDSSWVDVPPIKESYADSGDYQTYRDYFINNNDGEFYTNVSHAFPGDPDMPTSPFDIPSDTVPYKDYRWDTTWGIGEASGIGTVSSNVFVEFDEEIETTGIRLYIAETYDWTARANPQNTGALLLLGIFSTAAMGSYLSPVFDTLTEINSERVFSTFQDVSTSSGTVLVRSSSERPLYKDNTELLTWQPWNYPFKDTSHDLETGESWSSKSAIFSYQNWPTIGLVNDDKVYLFSNDEDEQLNPAYYDYKTNSWGFISAMGASGDEVYADDRVQNNAVVLDDGAMYVAIKMGNQNSARVMRYDFSPDEYNITGWRHLQVNRPPEATSCAMIGYGMNLYFFGEDGTTTRYNVESGTWDPTLARVPLHGDSVRRYAWPVLVGHKVYLIWGMGSQGLPYIDVYDISTDTWQEVAEFPLFPGKLVQALLYENKIYIIPRFLSITQTAAICIFDTETNTFESSNLFRLKSNNFNKVHNATFYAGAAWVYEGYLYCFSQQNGAGGQFYMSSVDNTGLRRCKLERDEWESGFIPSFIDPAWGNANSSDIGWQEVASLGEVMPQNRYFQFKVQMRESDTEEEKSSLIETASVVVPQVVNKVPASGSSSFWLKLGVSSESTYEGWYGGANLNYGGTDFGGYSWTVFNTRSRDGYSIDVSHQCFELDDFNYHTDSYRESKHSPWVIKNTAVDYAGWFSSSRSPDDNESQYTLVSGSVHSMSSQNGREWDSLLEVLPLGSEGQYDTHSAVDPCVIRQSTSDYKMWYTGVELGTNIKRILYCTSTDGLSWSNFALNHDKYTPGLPLQADIAGAYAPSVLYDEEEALYVMWYSGINVDGQSSIIRCASVDGFSWTDHQIVIPFSFQGYIDTQMSHYPCVIKDVDTFKIWYIGQDQLGEERVLYSESSDGVSWAVPFTTLYKNLHGVDNGAVGRLCVVSNRELELPNQYLSGAKVKIYNE